MKRTLQTTDALTGAVTTQPITQEFLAGLPTEAQFYALPAFSANDQGATPHPDGNGGHVAAYHLETTEDFARRPGSSYWFVSNEGDIQEITADGMANVANVTLDIHTGRSFRIVERGADSATIQQTEAVASANAYTYDGLL